jgi:predicted nuclease of predicted toxin-antitoxin system
VRWLVDECVDAKLVAWLRELGHDVAYVAETAPAERDSEIIQRAQADGRLLLTEDKDFGDLVFRLGHQVPGIVLLRIEPAMHDLKRRRFEAAVAHFGNGLTDRYTTIEPARFRSRPLRR